MNLSEMFPEDFQWYVYLETKLDENANRVYRWHVDVPGIRDPLFMEIRDHLTQET